MLSWLPTYLFLFIYHPKYDFFPLALPNRVGLAKLEGGGLVKQLNSLVLNNRFRPKTYTENISQTDEQNAHPHL